MFKGGKERIREKDYKGENTILIREEKVISVFLTSGLLVTRQEVT